MTARPAALLGACALLWFLEWRWPLVHPGRDGRRPVAPNLVLAALTVATNLALTAALRSVWLGGRSWDGVPLAVVAVHELLSALNALLEHANVALPERAERAVRWLFVTPHLHKWHHSRDAAETDTNYGNILSVWDRLFGTFTGRLRLDGLRYGLDGFDGAESQSVRFLLKMPMAR